MAELPHLVQVAEEFAAAGGRVVAVSQDLFVPGVSADEAMAKVAAFVARRGLPIPVVVLDDEDLDGVNAAFDLPGPIPVTLAFDRAGQEVDRIEAGADVDRLRAMMRKALGQ